MQETPDLLGNSTPGLPGTHADRQRTKQDACVPITKFVFSERVKQLMKDAKFSQKNLHFILLPILTIKLRKF